jgi:hypothetical protein
MGDRPSRRQPRPQARHMTMTHIVLNPAHAAPTGPSPLLGLDRVEAFLDEHGLGRGPLRAQRIGEGQSNVLTAVAALLTAVGLAGFRRRDIPIT